MEARGNTGAAGYLNAGTTGFAGPVGVQTPRQVSPFNGVNASSLLASQGTTAQQLQLQQQLRNLDLQRQQQQQQQQQQLLQYQQRTVSGGAGLPNVNLSQYAGRPVSHMQMSGQDQLLSQRLQQQAAQAALARGRTSPSQFLGRTSGGMVGNQLGNLSARANSSGSGSSIDNIVRLLSSHQQNQALGGVGSQAPSSHIQSLLGRRTANGQGVNAQFLQTLVAARNNPQLNAALQNNLSNLNAFNNGGINRGTNNATPPATNGVAPSPAGKQALLQQVLAAAQAQCSQNSGQGRVVPGAGGQLGGAQSAQELLVQLGFCFARLGISVDAAVKAGLLGGLGAQDIRLLADAHTNEIRKLNPQVDLSSQLSGLGLSGMGSIGSDVGGGGTGSVNGSTSSLAMPRNGQKLSVTQMAASMDLDAAKADDKVGGIGMVSSGELASLISKSNFGLPEYQDGSVKELLGEGKDQKLEAESVIRAQSEVLLADNKKFDSNAYAFFGEMEGDGEELGGLEDKPLEDSNVASEEKVVIEQPSVGKLVPEAVGEKRMEQTPRKNEDKVIQFGKKSSLLLVAEKVETSEDKKNETNDITKASSTSTDASSDNKGTSQPKKYTITDEDLYERFQDIGIGFE